MLAKAFSQLLIENKTTLTHVEDALRRFHLLPLLPSILDELKHHEKELRIKETVHIESPFPLNEENKQKIKHMLNAIDKEHIIIENKSLLAGFRARYQGNQVDSSMERILKTFTNQ